MRTQQHESSLVSLGLWCKKLILVLYSEGLDDSQRLQSHKMLLAHESEDLCELVGVSQCAAVALSSSINVEVGKIDCTLLTVRTTRCAWR